MEQSANLKLPYIMPSQAQKHVTHNEAIRTLDALVQLAVLDRDLSAPPMSPEDGERYLVAAAATGVWTGKEGSIAAWQDGAWAFLTPQAGWLLWVADETRLLGFDGTAWIDAAVHSVNPATLVGVNTAADATNRFAVKSPASLFDEEAGDHRIKINKASAGDTASLVFQSGYSGRAEFGLAGDDDWHVKVSADGAVWTDALKIDRATGRVSLPAALPLGDQNQVVTRRHVREVLVANRTYYVRTDGNDANNGLADNSGGAFLTIAKAIATVSALDLSIYNVTIQLQDTTWTEGVLVPGAWIGSGTVTLRGASNACVLNASTTLIVSGVGSKVELSDLDIRGSVGVIAQAGGQITCRANMIFSGTATHMRTNGPGSSITMNNNYSITSGGTRHFQASPGGSIVMFGITITLSGTLSFSTAFAQADRTALISTNACTFTGGTVTGKRYDATINAVIYTGGAGASHYPGNVAGTTATGGQYA
jgi:hypothetical protein